MINSIIGHSELDNRQTPVIFPEVTKYHGNLFVILLKKSRTLPD